MGQEDADQPTPQETLPAPNGERDKQRESNPEKKGPADKHDNRILRQMFTIHLGIGHAILEEPANMCVEKSFYRAMGITLSVRLSMVFHMSCSPFDGCPFQCH